MRDRKLITQGVQKRPIWDSFTREPIIRIFNFFTLKKFNFYIGFRLIFEKFPQIITLSQKKFNSHVIPFLGVELFIEQE